MHLDSSNCQRSFFLCLHSACRARVLSYCSARVANWHSSPRVAHSAFVHTDAEVRLHPADGDKHHHPAFSARKCSQLNQNAHSQQIAASLDIVQRHVVSERAWHGENKLPFGVARDRKLFKRRHRIRQQVFFSLQLCIYLA